MAYIARRNLVVGAEQQFDEDGSPVLDESGAFVYKEILRLPGEAVPEADSWSVGAIQALIRTDQIELEGSEKSVESLERRVTALEMQLAILLSNGITIDSPMKPAEEETEVDSGSTDEQDEPKQTASAPRRKKVVA